LSEKKARLSPVGSTLDLPALEHGILDLWERERSFEALRKKNAGGPRFSFIDGPITANIAAMGVHHAWGRTYKDLFQRYKAMRGFDQRYQNGFDCQGLWVEVEVEKELKLNSKREIEAYGLDRFADACIRRVRTSADAISTQSARLGQWMDWSDSYYTLSDLNISHIWAVLKIAHERGWLYKGHRSMPWCARCGTALSQHEMIDSYREMTHTSVYVRFPVEGRAGEAFLVWTTTPWTLAANVALAVHPDLEYVRVRLKDGVVVVGRKVFEGAGWSDATVLETVKGKDLLGLRFRGPFDELPAAMVAVPHHRVIAWDEVGEEEGTGIVHIAPGCGEADFQLSKTEGLPVLVPIDDSARFLDGFGDLTGREARGVAPEVVRNLTVKGLLFRSAPITHRYPECWRCHEEIVFRVDDEWFLSMDEIRPQLKEAAAKAKWVPESAGKRMQDWLLNMGDWNISRKRYWGLPLPFYTCEGCSHFFVLGSEEELRERAKSGLDGLRELHRPWIDGVVVACPKCGGDARRVKEVGDCWLDAGIVPFSTLDWLHDKKGWAQWFPADFITEMREQIRLWFYSQLFFSVVLTGRAPYESVLAYEKLLDESGRAMHRSWGNVIVFPEAAEKVGADAMRWLYSRQNVQENILFGYGPLDAVKRRLLTLWNTYSFFVTYANLDGFDPNAPAPDRASRPLLDRWILSRLNGLVREATADLEAYDPQGPALAIERFVDDLSDWYVRRGRRRFWKSSADADKASAERTLYEVLTTLVRVAAPYMPFLTEAIYQNLERHAGRTGAPASVHHTAWPAVDDAAIDLDLEKRMAAVRRLVDLGRSARGQAGAKTRTPLSRMIVAYGGEDAHRDVVLPSGPLAEIVCDELNVKRIELAENSTGLVEQSVQLDLKKMGARLGSRVPEIQKRLRGGAYTTNPDGTLQVDDVRLGLDEVQIMRKPAPGYALGWDGGCAALLDLAVTPELEAEGLARELAHRVNVLRKDAGFAIEDRITLRYAGAIAPTVERYRELLAGEVLATSVTPGLAGRGHLWRGELNGVVSELEIERT